MRRRIVVAISGASGAVYGIRSLEVLHSARDIETHLVLTQAARLTITQETEWRVSDVEGLADYVYASNDTAAAIASGSFETAGMLIAPCSIKTLSAVAHSFGATLASRAADVHLKEGRTVVLLVRETPLHIGHIRLMQLAAENGAIIMPPVPAFYGHPKSIDDIVNGTVGRALHRLGIENALYTRWGEPETGQANSAAE
jgi:4-hydroxy-3-polyprenylbenzoate decarboxylase